MFLPVSMQAEPLEDVEPQQYKVRSVPQLKAMHELELMHSVVILYLADSSALRRYDF